MAVSLFGAPIPFTRAQGVTRTFSGVTRRPGRVGDLPYSRIWPQHLVDNLDVLRTRAKWLTRNNPFAAGLARDLAQQIIGRSGIMPGSDEPVWQTWAMDPEQCDVNGRMTLAGLEWLAVKSMIVTGEAFIVLRPLRADSRWPLPLRIDVFDGDALSWGPVSRPMAGARMQQGIEYGRRGQRLAYHFRVPSRSGYAGDDVPIRILARDVIHIFEPLEPGIERGVTWFAPALLELSDLGAYQAAVIKRAEVAAKFVAITSRLDNVDGSVLPSEEDDDPVTPGYELQVSPGTEVKPFHQPPGESVKDFSVAILSAVAASVGSTVEDLTGNYQGMPFSAARLSRLKHEERLAGIRGRGPVPAVRRIWGWAREGAAVRGHDWPPASALEWPDPPSEAVDRDKESRAASHDVRSGFATISGELRRRGKVPRQHLAQYRDDLEMLDEFGLVLDTDPRKLTAQGQAQRVDVPAAGGASDGDE